MKSILTITLVLITALLAMPTSAKAAECELTCAHLVGGGPYYDKANSVQESSTQPYVWVETEVQCAYGQVCSLGGRTSWNCHIAADMGNVVTGVCAVVSY